MAEHRPSDQAADAAATPDPTDAAPLPAPEDVLDFSLLDPAGLDALAAATGLDEPPPAVTVAGRRPPRRIRLGVFAYGAFVAAVGLVLVLDSLLAQLSTSVAVAAIVSSMAVLAATVSRRVRPGPG